MVAICELYLSPPVLSFSLSSLLISPVKIIIVIHTIRVISLVDNRKRICVELNIPPRDDKRRKRTCARVFCIYTFSYIRIYLNKYFLLQMLHAAFGIQTEFLFIGLILN